MSAYYNEIDPYAAQWLRNLIAAGHIAPGDVDERSIEDVRPDDLRGYTQCHFFAGIGVWSLALRRAGWSDDRPVWTGSCPCQPFSAAGKRGGTADERHLWPAFHHLIAECGPPVVLGEQVASKDGLGWLDLVQADLEGTGYASGAVDLCAAGVGAPHIRQRLWWVAERVGHAGRARTEARLPEPMERKSRVADVDDDGSDRLFRSDQGQPEPGGVGNSGGIGRQSQPPQLREHGDGMEPGRREQILRLEASRDVPIGLADTDGHEQRTGRDDRSAQGERFRSDADRRINGGGLADATASGRREECADAGRLAVGDGAERQPAGLGAGSGDCRPGPTNGHWRDADWLFCRDGKWRPVEPGTSPLVNGAPARVGRLRAYGNAIVADAAQAFIEAYLASQADRLRLTDLSVLTTDEIDTTDKGAFA